MTIILDRYSPGSSEVTYTQRKCTGLKTGGCTGHTHSWASATLKGFANGNSGKTVLASGTNPPGWRERIGKEIVPYTERHVRGYTWFSSPSQVDTTYCYAPSSAYRVHWDGIGCCINSVTIPSPPALYSDLDVLLQKAWAEVNTTGWQVLVDLAERKETLELFTKARDRYTKRARKIFEKTAIYFKNTGRPVKCSRQKVAEFTDVFSDVWLEKRYGWDQLVRSAEDIADAWRHWETPNEPIFVVGKEGATVSVTTEIPSSNIVVQHASAYEVLKRERKTSILARAKVIALCRREFGAFATRGITINPFSTVYELIPYSFVADWFWNVGDIFAAHWPSAAFAGTTAAVSEKWTDEVEIEVDIKQNLASQPRTSGTRATLSFRNQEYHRTPRSDVPLALRYQPDLSPKRVMDAVGLIRRFIPNAVSKWARCIFT